MVVGVALLALVVGLGWGCRAVQERVEAAKPRVEVSGARLRSISPTSMLVEAQATVDNPNPIGAHIESVTYDIFFRRGEVWVVLGRGEKRDFQIRPQGSTALELPVTVDNLALVQALATALAQGGVVPIKISGTVRVKVGPTAFTIPFEQERTAFLLR